MAVVKHLDIELGEGFNVFTGETGAGKSVIIKSISSLMGEKMSKDMIRQGENYALIEGVFESVSDEVKLCLEDMGLELDDGGLVLSRRMNADGKNVFRINGRTVTTAMFREIGTRLISVHGQNDTRLLTERNEQRRLLDKSISDLEIEHSSDLSLFADTWQSINNVKKRKKELTLDMSEKLRRREMLAFQLKDIDSVKPVIGEEEELRRERDRLSDMERIEKYTDFTRKALNGAKGSAVDLIARSEDAMSRLSESVSGASELVKRMESVRYELVDIAETAAAMSRCDGDPRVELENVETRLDLIKKIERKYGSSISEILEYRNKAESELSLIDSSDDIIAELEAEEKKLLSTLKEAGERIRKRRKASADKLSAEVSRVLAFLDMPKVVFKIDVREAEPDINGYDQVEFLIAANPGEIPGPMSKIASGGELSRITLALKSILNSSKSSDCSIYDEIDTGISGSTARKVGMKLHSLSDTGQVLCVTHSAQIASLAGRHLLISKNEVMGRAETTVKQIEGEQRIDELARIIGGINITPEQRIAASQMIIN